MRGDEATSTWAVSVPVGYRVGRWEVTAGIATGSWGSVYAAVSRVKTALGDRYGGVIGQAEINQGYSLENIRAFFEAWWGRPEED